MFLPLHACFSTDAGSVVFDLSAGSVFVSSAEQPEVTPRNRPEMAATMRGGLGLLPGILAGFQPYPWARRYLSQLVSWGVLESLVGYAPSGPGGEPELFGSHTAGTGPKLVLVGLLIAPFVGGLVSGALCRWLAPEASGHGTDAVIDAYHNQRGQIRARVPLVKALATAISLGTGGSGGREGPIAQIGAGFGSLLGRVLKLSGRQRRILLAAGMGAGVGAIFRAPLAGALFAAEILYREAEFESDVLIPSVLSSALAYCVYCGKFGFGHLFELDTAEFVFGDVLELGPYTLLALFLVPVVIFYTKFFYGMERLFARIPGPRPLVVGLGALLTGVVGVGFYLATDDENALSVMSYGYGIVQHALDGELLGWAGVRLLLMIAILKILTTSFTISSGGSGGVFGPSMVIGGCLGGAVGFVGIFSAHDVREFTFDESVHQLAIAADLMTTDPIHVTLDMDLHTALSRFSVKELDELPVVDAEDPTRLLGMLRRRAIARAYNERLKELKELQRQER